jgi:uncharacterized protein YjbI with pentapeptide repeats
LKVCKFKGSYFGSKVEDEIDFQCDEDALNSGLCIFHDNTYLKDPKQNSKRKQEVSARLVDKINESISKNMPLICVGYHLPDIKINRSFPKNVFFTQCQIEEADFSNTTFCDGADFSNVEFLGDANFVASEFEGDPFMSDVAYFFKTRFYAAPYFSECKVKGGATFYD